MTRVSSVHAKIEVTSTVKPRNSCVSKFEGPAYKAQAIS